MKNEIKPIEALVKIKIRINKYYENLGRYEELNEDELSGLIEDIEDIIEKVKIPDKLLIIESLRMGTENGQNYGI